MSERKIIKKQIPVQKTTILHKGRIKKISLV